MSQNDEDITARSKNDVIKVLQLLSHAKKLTNAMNFVLRKKEDKPAQTEKRHHQHYHVPPVHQHVPQPTSAEWLSILNESNAIVGVDILKESSPCIEIAKTGKKTKNGNQLLKLRKRQNRVLRRPNQMRISFLQHHLTAF